MEALQRMHNRGSISTGYNIDHSLKLEDANNEWLYRASPTAGNRKTYTFSFWIKRTELGLVNTSGNQFMIGQGQHGRMYFGSDYFQYRFDDGHDCRNVSQQFRDSSAWYHFVVSVDTNQVSSGNRVKLYVNGESLAVDDHDGGSFPDIQDSGAYFSTSYLTIGTAPFGGSYNSGDGDYDMSGYLAEFCGIDGTAYAPTDFGEFDEDSGIWKPKDVSELTFGSEGFYLNFSNASNLGEDFSGNDNDFTSSNLSAADQATDTPTNNFCTLNPLMVYGNALTTGPIEGATKVSGGSWAGTRGTMGVENGKWYYEFKTSGGDSIVGIQTDDGVALTGNGHNILSTCGFYVGTGGEVWIKDSTSGRNDRDVTHTFNASTINGIAINMDDNQISFYQNGSLVTNGGNIDLDGLSNKTVFPFASNYNTTQEFNFGGYTPISISSAATDENGYGTFEYAPPSGYYALCTKNLAEYG
jgi:hypothetical protein